MKLSHPPMGDTGQTSGDRKVEIESKGEKNSIYIKA